MKKLYFSILILCIVLLSISCGTDEKGDSAVFMATVLENESSLLVEPQKDTTEIKSSDKIVVNTNNSKFYDANGNEITLSDIAVSEIVQITYNGMIAESYPAQISANIIKIME
jgi:hypothetical protein